MSSEEQIKANQENGMLGGVKSDEGKKISKLNALKHGLLSQEVVLSGENQEDYNSLREGLINQFQPDGDLEFFCIEKMAIGIWRIRRSLAVQKAKSDLVFKPIEVTKHIEDWTLDKENPTSEQVQKRDSINSFESISDLQTRYETSIVNDIWKSLHELERLQATRRGEKVLPRIAVDVDISDEKNGFVS